MENHKKKQGLRK